MTKSFILPMMSNTSKGTCSSRTEQSCRPRLHPTTTESQASTFLDNGKAVSPFKTHMHEERCPVMWILPVKLAAPSSDQYHCSNVILRFSHLDAYK